MSPLNSWRVSMVLVFRVMTELSSFTASSTISRLGDFFLSNMAVLKSFLLQGILSQHFLGLAKSE